MYYLGVVAKSSSSTHEILDYFHEDQPLKWVAVKLGISPNRLRDLWKSHYGEAAFEERVRKHQKGAPPGSADLAIEAFTTEEPFKALAKRLGMSPNTIRKIWVARFGAEAFRARGKASQAKGAISYGVRSTGLTKKKNFVCEPCSGCNTLVSLTKVQLAALTKVVCETCLGMDSKCPVCNLGCMGVKGVAMHFAQVRDKAHLLYQEEKEEEKWSGLTENVHYVTCKECGFRGAALSNHLKLHGLDASSYRTKFKDALVTSSFSDEKRLKSLMPSASRRAYHWSPEVLRQFTDEKGRVIVAEAALALGASPLTVLHYCRALELPTRNKLAWQRVVLDQASKAFEAPYVWEWSDPRIVNPSTGRVFNFDGYFPNLNLIVEAHGDQHCRYAEAWHGSLENFHALRERDAFKKQRAEELGFRVLVVRPVDPTHSVTFWKRLSPVDPIVLASQINRIVTTLRQGVFPMPKPLDVELKKALTRLQGTSVVANSDLVIYPYSVVGTSACASFFPARYQAKHKAVDKSVWEAWHDDDLLRKAIKLQLDSGHPTTPERVLKALVMYHRTPSVFRPAVAKYVYQTYGNNGVVWDPCAGYGGRLLGALAAGVHTYIGTDIEPATVEGNLAIAKHLGVSGSYKVELHAAEDFDPGVPLDLVFTSPPYFDLETYGKASLRASVGYGSPQGWVESFLRPVMIKAMERLKPGGYLVLNLPYKPVLGTRLDVEASREAKGLGLRELPTLWMPIRTFKGTMKGEPLLVWQKE